jgi:hypothetical protein
MLQVSMKGEMMKRLTPECHENSKEHSGTIIKEVGQS